MTHPLQLIAAFFLGLAVSPFFFAHEWGKLAKGWEDIRDEWLRIATESKKLVKLAEEVEAMRKRYESL